MKIYIKPKNIQAISFDLDDTLYDNRPIIARAERELMLWLHANYPKAQRWSILQWQQLKGQLLISQPALNHDVTLSRALVLNAGLQQLGYSEQEAQQGAEAALAQFVYYRSDFEVSTEVIALLTKLKTQFTLFGISNGNVDVTRIGLGDMLDFSLRPGEGFKSKPYGDLFHVAADKISLPTSDILHVGDNAYSDIYGARKAGAQAAWLNPGYGAENIQTAHKVLPHIELTDIQQLAQLLD